jgi:Mor family transcriptional regulator
VANESEEKQRLRAFVDTAVTRIKERLIAVLKMPEADATELARDCTHDICVEYGGRYMYVVKDVQYDLSKRDREIYNAYNGRNMLQITAKYRITHTRVYQIVNAIHAEELAKRQSQLPGLDA